MNRKTVVITGSSRGIGKAAALRFARENYNVVINCVKSKDKLMQVKEEIESYNAPCLAYACDIGVYENARELFSLVKKEFGGCDILVNNAGISYIGMLQDMSPEDFGKIIQTNVNSVYNCCHEAIPQMLANGGGRIVNISSVWGVCGASCEVAYSASKGAVNSFTKALGKELAASNICVNALACGAVNTEMNSFLSKDELDALVNEIPAFRLGRAEEIADMIYEMAVNHPSYLTGQVIQMDGGWV